MAAVAVETGPCLAPHLSRASACRSLFGRIDHAALRKALAIQQCIIEKRNAERWNFDFKREKPLSGQYEWSKVERVPVAYAMTQLLQLQPITAHHARPEVTRSPRSDPESGERSRGVDDLARPPHVTRRTSLRLQARQSVTVGVEACPGDHVVTGAEMDLTTGAPTVPVTRRRSREQDGADVKKEEPSDAKENTAIHIRPCTPAAVKISLTISRKRKLSPGSSEHAQDLLPVSKRLRRSKSFEVSQRMVKG